MPSRSVRFGLAANNLYLAYSHQPPSRCSLLGPLAYATPRDQARDTHEDSKGSDAARTRTRVGLIRWKIPAFLVTVILQRALPKNSCFIHAIHDSFWFFSFSVGYYTYYIFIPIVFVISKFSPAADMLPKNIKLTKAGQTPKSYYTLL